MELELKKEAIKCYEVLENTSLVQDESLETIVPDQLPDIGRLLTSEGQVFLRSCETHDGKAELRGVIRAVVLYTADNDPSIQKMNFEIPFVMIGECEKDTSVLRASIRAEDFTTRTLNPRKVQAQCRLLASLEPYRKAEVSYSTEVEAPEELGIETQLQEELLSTVAFLPEKDFTYEETLALSASRGSAADILLTRIRGTVSDAKIIGKKIAVKGTYFVDCLFKYTSGTCEMSSFELPFSQIIDCENDVDAEMKVMAVLHLTGAETKLIMAEEDRPSLSFTAYSHLELTLVQEKKVPILSDLYSTVYPEEIEMGRMRLLSPAELTVRRQIVQESLELGAAAASVLSVRAECGSVALSHSDGVSELHAPLRVHLIYQGEEGRILAAERNLEARLLLPDLGDKNVIITAESGDELSAAPTGDGIALRLPVDFYIRESTAHQVGFVSAARCDTEHPKDLSKAPSLILRRRGAGESLWSIAKHYGTTISEILAANGGGESELTPGELILIPKKRI